MLRVSSRRSVRICLAVLLLLAIINLYVSVSVQIEYQSPWHFKYPPSENSCSPSSSLSRIVITVKTGATEAPTKIPTQLRTSLRCAPHVYVFSDMAQTLHPNIRVIDALDTIPKDVMVGNKDFDIYRKQQILRHDDPSIIVDVLSDFKHPENHDELAAWTLDKYKNLHIVEKAWALKPDMDWYFHIDADTYVVWPTLLEWVSRLDPQKESFLGSLALINDFGFAHGGSGLLLSNAATRNLVLKHNGTAAKWDHRISEHCCGDYVLSKVLFGYGIDVKNASPTINGETVDTIPFSNWNWCEPIVTMHHVSPIEAERFAAIERSRANQTVCVFFHVVPRVALDLSFEIIMGMANMT
jgi:hypothetical protein